MIQKLRRRHWRTFLLLAIVLPLLFIIAVVARQDPPAPTADPTGLEVRDRE